MQEKRIVYTVLILCLSGIGILTNAQDITYPKEVVNRLASPKMHGRGYVKNGDTRAASYLQSELKKMGVLPVGSQYLQPLNFPINTFPGKMKVALNNITLAPVNDYVVAPNCKTISGTFPLVYLPAAADTSDALFDSLANLDFNGKFIVAPFSKRKLTRDNPFKTRGVIIPAKKLYWWLSTGDSQNDVALLLIKDSILLEKPSEITLTVENEFIENYTSNNVMGYIEGSEQPDSVMVFCAHYDHLGLMGKKNVFNGANDNASGTAMVLWLAQHFAQPANKPKCSMLFLFFTGEERGLLGSTYFVENSPVPLEQIKAVINLDMVGTGSNGISIINGKMQPKISETLVALNQANSYFTDVVIGGESCNSDHCPFHNANVPAVFIFTRGGEFQEYHNLDDVAEKLPFTKFYALQQLLIAFTAVF